jgi:hypothetical protein
MSLRFPVLNLGVTNESFHCAGKIPVDSDLLKIMQSGVFRGKWGYVEHGAKRNILLFLHETSFKTCFMQK